MAGTACGGDGNGDGARGSESSGEKASSAACKGCYRGHGVSFSYPPKWHKVDQLEAPTVGQWYVAFGLGEFDFVRVYRGNLGQGDFDPDALYRTTDHGHYRAERPTPVTAENLKAFEDGFAALVRERWKEYGAGVRSGPEQLTVSGRPALRFRATRASEEAFRPASMILFVFDGMTEYQLECYHTRKTRAELERGCAQFVRTFKVGRS